MFLWLQYLRMINSDEFVVERWRSSCDRFLRDLWDRTPATPGRRFLAPIDIELGYSPDNVEWQFPKIKRSQAATKRAKMEPTKVRPVKTIRPSKEDRKQAERIAAAEKREVRRASIAEEFARWEAVRLLPRTV